MCVQFKKTNCMRMFPLIRKSQVDFLLFMPSGSIIDESNSPITDMLSCVSGTVISKRCDPKWALKTAMFIKKKSIGLC